MPNDWWLDSTVLEVLSAWGAVLGVIAALLVIGRITVKYLHPLLRKFSILYDKIMGRDPNPRLGDAGEPGIFVQMEIDREDVKSQISEVRGFVQTRLAEQDALLVLQNEQVAEIKKQVTPNHGSTERLADQIHDLRERVRNVEGYYSKTAIDPEGE